MKQGPFLSYLIQSPGKAYRQCTDCWKTMGSVILVLKELRLGDYKLMAHLGSLVRTLFKKQRRKQERKKEECCEIILLSLCEYMSL